MGFTLYATEALVILNRISISLVMVGAANSDSTRISFFGSTKGELAQKWDRVKTQSGTSAMARIHSQSYFQ
jgi:hypothetical protein